jgi:hypothetical protein
MLDSIGADCFSNAKICAGVEAQQDKTAFREDFHAET